MKNQDNYTIIKSPISYIGLFLTFIFFYLRFKEIYFTAQVAIFIIIITLGIYFLFKSYKDDRINHTTNFKEKLIVISVIFILFIISYFLLPSFFK